MPSGNYFYSILFICAPKHRINIVGCRKENKTNNRLQVLHIRFKFLVYSKIPILKPPLGLSKSGLKDHFWTVPKVVCNQRYTVCRK